MSEFNIQRLQEILKRIKAIPLDKLKRTVIEPDDVRFDEANSTIWLSNDPPINSLIILPSPNQEPTNLINKQMIEEYDREFLRSLGIKVD